MTDELKPVRCGCGGKAMLYVSPITTRWLLQCESCKIETTFYDSEAEAIKAWNRAMGEKPEMKWTPVTEALPNNEEYDWVLGQIRETDSGYLWIPRQVEYREIKDDWYEDSIGWLKENPDHAFEVIAWMPLPESYKGD